MKNEDKIEEILLKGTQDDLSELRVWLFKEAVRLENLASTIDSKKEHLESEKFRLKNEIAKIRSQIEFDKEKLAADNEFFEEKLRILREGYDKLTRDKKQLDDDREYFARERRYLKEEEQETVSAFFRGVNSPLALKKRYKDLIKIFHPDNLNGDQEIIQMINREYSVLCSSYGMQMKA